MHVNSAQRETALCTSYSMFVSDWCLWKVILQRAWLVIRKRTMLMLFAEFVDSKEDLENNSSPVRLPIHIPLRHLCTL